MKAHSLSLALLLIRVHKCQKVTFLQIGDKRFFNLPKKCNPLRELSFGIKSASFIAKVSWYPMERGRHKVPLIQNYSISETYIPMFPFPPQTKQFCHNVYFNGLFFYD